MRFPTIAILAIFVASYLGLHIALFLPVAIGAHAIFQTVSVATLVGNGPLAITNPVVAMFAGMSAIATAGAVMVTSCTVHGPFIADLGFDKPARWKRHAITGIVIGPVAFLVILIVEILVGWTTAERGSIRPFGLLTAATGFAFVAFSEELLCRGFLLTVLQRRYGTWIAVAGSSALFGLLHALNPGASPIAVTMLVLAGVMFAIARLRTGALWLPITLHWSWNLAQGPVFGFPVSGSTSDGILSLQTSGPTVVTGGAFGPEAGLVGFIGLGIALAGILVVTRRSPAPHPALRSNRPIAHKKRIRLDKCNGDRNQTTPAQ